jgi:hypothetical protein
MLTSAAAHGLNNGIGVSLFEQGSRSVGFFARMNRVSSLPN